MLSKEYWVYAPDMPLVRFKVKRGLLGRLFKNPNMATKGESMRRQAKYKIQGIIDRV